MVLFVSTDVKFQYCQIFFPKGKYIAAIKMTFDPLRLSDKLCRKTELILYESSLNKLSLTLRPASSLLLHQKIYVLFKINMFQNSNTDIVKGQGYREIIRPQRDCRFLDQESRTVLLNNCKKVKVNSKCTHFSVITLRSTNPRCMVMC